MASQSVQSFGQKPQPGSGQGQPMTPQQIKDLTNNIEALQQSMSELMVVQNKLASLQSDPKAKAEEFETLSGAAQELKRTVAASQGALETLAPRSATPVNPASGSLVQFEDLIDAAHSAKHAASPSNPQSMANYAHSLNDLTDYISARPGKIGQLVEDLPPNISAKFGDLYPAAGTAAPSRR